MSFQRRYWCLAAFDFFKDSVHLLEERLLTVSAELPYNSRKEETNFIYFICLQWERKAVAHECVHRVSCAIQPWKLGQLHLFLIPRCRRARAPILAAGCEGRGCFSSKNCFSGALNTNKLKRQRRTFLMTKWFTERMWSLSFPEVPLQYQQKNTLFLPCDTIIHL